MARPSSDAFKTDVIILSSSNFRFKNVDRTCMKSGGTVFPETLKLCPGTN